MTQHIYAERYYTPGKLREKISSTLKDNEELSLDVSRLKKGFGFDLKNISDCINGTGFFERNENTPPRINKKFKEAIVDRFNEDDYRHNLGSKGTPATALVIDANKFGQNKTLKLLEAIAKEGSPLESLTIKNLNLNTPKKSKQLTEALDGLSNLKSLELFSLKSNDKSIDKFLNRLSENNSLTDVYMSARDGRYTVDPMGYLSKKKPPQLIKDAVAKQNPYYGSYSFSEIDFPFGTKPTELSPYNNGIINRLSSNNREREATERIEASQKSLADIAAVTIEQSLKQSGEKSNIVEQTLNDGFKHKKLNTNPGEDEHVLRLQRAMAERADRNHNGRA